MISKSFVLAGLISLGTALGASSAHAATIITDNFSDGNYTSNPTWTTAVPDNYAVVTDAGGNALLLKANTDKTTISLNLGALKPGEPVSVSFATRASKNTTDGYFIQMSLLDTSSGKGYMIMAANNGNQYGPAGARSGFYLSSSPSGNGSTIGPVNATLNQNTTYQTLVFTYDPGTSHVTLTKNGVTMLDYAFGTFAQDLPTVNEFQLMLSNYASGPDRYVKDVVVTGTPLPEPGGLSLLGLGGLMLIGRRKRASGLSSVR